MESAKLFSLRETGRYSRQGRVFNREFGEAVVVERIASLGLIDLLGDEFLAVLTPYRGRQRLPHLAEEHRMAVRRMYEVKVNDFTFSVGIKRANNGLNRMVIQAPDEVSIFPEEQIQNR